MKIIDVSFMDEFKNAEMIDDYWSLICFFSKYTPEFWNDLNIYTENHHIYPKCETFLEIPITVQLPFYFHFKAHLLRARESKGRLRGYNYSSAFMIMKGKSVRRSCFSQKEILQMIYRSFSDEIYESKKRRLSRSSAQIALYNESLKGKTYEEIYGAEKSSLIKEKLSLKTTIKNYNESCETRLKRKQSIKKYAENRPQSHNDNISVSKTGKKCPAHGRKVIHLNTMKIYETISDAKEQTGFSGIRECCVNLFQQCKNQFWQFYEENTDYGKIYELKKANLNKKGFKRGTLNPRIKNKSI